MRGVDVLVFTGGIGENSVSTRAGVCEDLEFLGVEIDPQINEGVRGEERIISKEGSKVKVMVVPTNEELMIAIDTQNIVYGKK